jgi:hypothetical protein
MFAPATAGTKTAGLRFTDDATATPHTALLSGTATSTTQPAAAPLAAGQLSLFGGAAPNGPLTVPLLTKAAARSIPAPLKLSVPTSVSATTTAPITVAATVPAGATVLQVRVFRLIGSTTRAAAAPKSARSKLIATVYRSTPKAKRYTFRLTENKLRHLEPGRYRVEVRAGKSRAALGPATARGITVTPAASTR